MSPLRLPAVLTREIKWADIQELRRGLGSRLKALWWIHERVVLSWRDGRIIETSSRARQTTADYLLTVPPNQTLSFDLRLDERYSRQLDRVIQDNLSVWTPFQPEEVWIQPVSVPKTGNRTVEIFYVPRAQLAPAIEGAKAANLRVDGLIFEGRAGPPLLLDNHAAFRRRVVRQGRAIGTILFVAFAVLAGVSGLDRLERTESHYKRETANSLRAFRAIEAPGNQAFDVLSKQIKLPLASSSLAEVLSKMPAQSVISEIEWKPDEIVIRLQRDTVETFRKAVDLGHGWQALEPTSSDQGLVTLRYKREHSP